MKKDIDVSTLTDEEICALYSYKIPLLSADGSCRCVVDTRIMCEAHNTGRCALYKYRSVINVGSR